MGTTEKELREMFSGGAEANWRITTFIRFLEKDFKRNVLQWKTFPKELIPSLPHLCERCCGCCSAVVTTTKKPPEKVFIVHWEGQKPGDPFVVGAKGIWIVDALFIRNGRRLYGDTTSIG